MLPMEFFTRFFNLIDFLSSKYGLGVLRFDFAVDWLTCCIYSTMFAAIPLIIYTVTTYELNVALRALSVVGITLQVIPNWSQFVRLDSRCSVFESH